MTRITGIFPSFVEEKKLWKKGYGMVIGIDEVGRGSWAGPVVAAAVVWLLGETLEPPANDFFGFRFSRKEALRLVQSFSRSQGKHSKIGPASRASSIALEEYVLDLGINDSKALRSQKREQLADIIKECSIWSVAEVGVGAINRMGIGKATQMAMRKAVANLISSTKTLNSKQIKNSKSSEIGISNLGPAKTFVLVDAFYISYLRGFGLRKQKAIVKGDQKSISIAAASILAKVYRDELMKKLAKNHPRRRDVYGWARNKGYGTKEHQQAILDYGLTRLHRKKFVGTFLEKRQN